MREDAAERDGPGSPTAPKPPPSLRIEPPTVLLAAVIHLGWIAATWAHASIPTWLLPIIGGWIVAWHGSLQHETIHGHPTGIRRLDTSIGSVPLALWLPYAIYRRTHLAHHATDRVTDPYDDPESRYLPDAAGRGAAALRLVARAQATLPGRLTIGPIVTVAGFLAAEAVRAWRDPGPAGRDWLPHLAGVAVVLLWLRACDLGVGRYLVCFVYPGVALSLLRSFAEHRADPEPRRRVAIVERAGVLGLLFLNNNLHAAHHRAPGVAWYRLPDYYRRHRAALVAGNGGLVYRGYGAVARRFLLRPHDRVVHPGYRYGP